MGFLPFASGGGAHLAPAPVADVARTLAWSDPLTWSGRLPGRRDVVQVPAGRSLLIDQDIDVAALEVAGEVCFAERDLRVECDGILVTRGGVLRAGRDDAPFTH
ncbi:MAG: G8 domain-containing protein, partial [Burkholderiaceae bacterium]|nr:G8 domain-containing protein [Burkholderiaceae bacterium]